MAALALLEKRPYLSHDLYDELERQGIDRTASATAVHRLLKTARLERLGSRLSHGRALLVAPQVTADSEFVRRLGESKFGGSPNLARVLTALASTHPAMAAADASKLAGIEIGKEPTPTLTRAHDLMRDLERLGLVSVVGRHGSQIVWAADDRLLRRADALTGPTRYGTATATTSLMLRYRLISQVATWLWQNGLTSKNGDHHATPEVPLRSAGGMGFDVVAFGHTRPLRVSQYRPRLVVGDVEVVGYGKSQADAYLHRLARVKARLHQTPLAFVLCKSFEPESFNRLRRAAVLPWTHRQFFNPAVEKAVTATLELAQAFAQSKELDPETFQAALEGAQQYGQLFGSIKGRLFEFIVAQLLQAMGVQNIRLGRTLQDGGLDVDVSGSCGPKAWIVECKGVHHEKTVPFDVVDRHFTTRVPAFRRSLRNDTFTRVREFNAILAATAPVETRSNTGKSIPMPRADTTFEIWDRVRVLQLLGDHDLETCRQLVEKYY